MKNDLVVYRGASVHILRNRDLFDDLDTGGGGVQGSSAIHVRFHAPTRGRYPLTKKGYRNSKRGIVTRSKHPWEKTGN